jgi:hypothetical protein
MVYVPSAAVTADMGSPAAVAVTVTPERGCPPEVTVPDMPPGGGGELLPPQPNMAKQNISNNPN